MAIPYHDDRRFLLDHVDIVELHAPDQSAARVLVSPAWQGRVMTATCGPDAAAPSFGWVNRGHIKRVSTQGFAPRFNALGGSDRFWLGPEGSRYSIFFDGGSPFDIAHWRTPPCLDTEPWLVVGRPSPSEVVMRRDTSLINRAGALFDLRIDRAVRALSASQALADLGSAPVPTSGEPRQTRSLNHAAASKAPLVAYESINTITNIGARPWRRETGLLSIWILGMYPPGERSVIMLPFRAGNATRLGPLVNDAYFGPPAADRMAVRGSSMLFRADGRSRGKLGLSPRRATGIAGSYDPDRSMLTIVSCPPPDPSRPYVNSMWADDVDPFIGDAINAYNDGPVTPGGEPLGPFHELETSSPGAELDPGESLTHTHRTIHLTGPIEQLDAIACPLFGLCLRDASFPAP
ncbi:MAG: hypothetical protein HRU76_10740 [Phycisphaeraceae bacterium]|nr:hypothetical protein [Phycisphaerales bacterium]QOJ18032.1 MAG: hypothetical protein HRU76_10740 [Phycisphaeraceae bacterium]